MSSISKPNSDEDVYSVMKEYSAKKGYNLSESQLRYLAQDCYLLHESRKWSGSKYWPAIAMRHILNFVSSFGTKPIFSKSTNKGKTVRDIILEQENEF